MAELSVEEELRSVRLHYNRLRTERIQLDAENRRLKKEVDDLHDRLVESDARAERQDRRIAELERQLRQPD